MRVLLFLILITLACSEQPLMYEPQTRVQQGVPSGQIGPQIDTLFSSWKEFDNDPWGNGSIIHLYANQLDNGYFGLLGNWMGFVHYNFKGPVHFEQYKSVTYSFRMITTGLSGDYAVDLGFWHHDSITAYSSLEMYYDIVPVGPNDTCNVSWTLPVDSVVVNTGHEIYTAKDITDFGIAIGGGEASINHNVPYIYYLSELVVTAERRSHEIPGKGE